MDPAREAAMMIHKLGLRILACVAILVPLTAMPPANALARARPVLNDE
jgi:hypothetical protein